MKTPAEVEGLILAALEPMRESHGVRTLRGYGLELSVANLQEAALQLPAVLPVYQQSVFSSDGRQVDEEMLFEIFVADRNLRSEASARAGSGAHPGTYALLEGLQANLLHRDIDPGLMPLEIVSRQSAGFDRNAGIALYSAVYRTFQTCVMEYTRNA